MNFSKAWYFIKKNAFYLVLALCVIAIGVITLVSSLPEAKEDEKSQTVENVKDESLTDVKRSPAATIIPTTTPEASEEPSSEQKHRTTISRAKSTLSLAKPLDGEIIRAFSGDTLTFNKTLNMWMTHNGIDISSENNSDVVAALAGEIKSIKNDDSKGKIVEITHYDGSSTLYYGLKEVCIEEGGKVNANQKIGNAGTPAFESDSGAHLHFEYIVNGEYKDPAAYFG